MQKIGLGTWLFVSLMMVLILPPSARAQSDFELWLNDFQPVAGQQGVQQATWEKAFAGISDFDARVLEKANYQPEFTTKIWDYVDGRVNSISIARGLQMDRVPDSNRYKVELL